MFTFSIHYFCYTHFSIKQWLEQGKDHCAYCRKQMIKPEEFLQAAREELGNDRVAKILRINEAAATRLREYEEASAAAAIAAAMENDAPNDDGFESGIDPRNGVC
jgi:hypothetical protein